MKEKNAVKKSIYVSGILAITVALITIVVPAQAHYPGIVLSGFGTATIDGVLTPGEWEDAGSIDFSANTPGGGIAEGTLLVMNDAFNLYIAVWVNYSAPGNTACITFDNDNGGEALEVGDDLILINPDIGFYDEVWTGSWVYDTVVEGTNDGTGEFSSDGVFTVYEFSHPLNSTDDEHDFSLSQGDTVGFNLSLRFIAGPNYPDDYGDTDFPSPSPSNPELFGDIVIVGPPLAPLYLSLGIEDAAEGIRVHKVAGDPTGSAPHTYVEIVATLFSSSLAATNDIPVVLTIPGDLFGKPVGTWVRNTPGGPLTPVAYDNLGGGQYRVTTDLSLWYAFPPFLYFYLKQIVWRFAIPNDASPQDVMVTAEVETPCEDPLGSGTIRILAPGSVSTVIIVNRTLLYEKYIEGSVYSLLERLHTEAQGHPASHTPRGVIYYVDRYDNQVANWKNAKVDYTSEATANVVANLIDDLIEDWVDDATDYKRIHVGSLVLVYPVARPNYLLIVGDDDTIPFYRYDDPYNRERFWTVDSAINPAILATDEDYFLTDNPYADLGNDWQTGDIELFVGRLLGDSAADMLKLLEEGVNRDNGQMGGVVMASVDGWELGLEPDDGRAGEIADLYDVPQLFVDKGFAVRNDDDPAAEVRTIDVNAPYEGGDVSWNHNFMDAANHADGMDLFFIGGHDSYDHAAIPDDDFSPGDTPARYNRFDDDHPIAIIAGCHGGLPVPDIDVPGGVNNSMVYDVIHEGARAYIGATGYSYGSPCNALTGDGLCLHKCLWAERLMQRFFGNLLMPVGSNSMTIGGALARAKRDFTFGYGNRDALDRKTVTEFNLYGVPWAFVFYPDANTAEALRAQDLRAVAVAEQGFTTVSGPVVRGTEEGVYSQTFDVEIEPYTMGTEIQNGVEYHLFSIEGGDVAVAPDTPILPYVKGYTLPLPFGASVTAVNVVDSTSASIGTHNIPIAEVEPWSEGGLTYTTVTDIDYPYPEDLVQYQQTSERLLFTIFPIQHNPTTDETTFYSRFTVQVTYESPLTVTVTEFNTDKQQYAPGETISTTTRIANVGDVAAVLTATLKIKDALGEVMGTGTSMAFTVPSGGSYVLPLSWTGALDDGAYTVKIELFSQEAIVGGASAAISVLGCEITGLTVPTTLMIGEEDIFQVLFANYTSAGVGGEAFLTIQCSQGGYLEELAPQAMNVAPGSTGTATFSWTPLGVSAAQYIAIARVVANGQTYGPITKSFLVTHEVPIDIKPGSYPNSINLGSQGVVPVAILSSDSFDATNVVPDTVELSGAAVAMRGKGNKYMAHEEDVNGDGLVDLVVQVGVQNLDPGQFQEGYAVLTAQTYDGVSVGGEDEITIVPQ
ncbi:MAG: hypothetical protein GTO40_17890 [Deltaproteobacteria bacterium]|nr:hypothetical protein [Deltaproteobacteria bacterium]